MMEAIEVMQLGDTVVISFDDDHEAYFYPYTHGFEYSIEGLQRFVLYNDKSPVFQYDARLYRYGPQDDQEQVHLALEGYTQQIAAEYWEEARQFVSELFKPGGFGSDTPSNDKYWYAWRVTSEGRLGLNRLKEGKAKVGEGVTV